MFDELCHGIRVYSLHIHVNMGLDSARLFDIGMEARKRGSEKMEVKAEGEEEEEEERKKIGEKRTEMGTQDGILEWKNEE